jgi:hypothetical protein
MRQIEKKNIIISIPLVWSYRNFIINGIGEELEREYEVYYAIPPVALETFEGLGYERAKLLVLEKEANHVLQVYLFRILKKAFSKRFPVNTTDIFGKLRNKANSNLKTRMLYDWPALIFANPFLFSMLERFERKLYVKKCKKVSKVLAAINPEFVLSTTNVVDGEWPLFRTAQQMKIKTLTHILSFDNLTSRGYLPIQKFDTYFVWNLKMKEELVKYYAISPSSIQITGTPQFDYHTDLQYLLSKAATLSKIGIEEPYLLYCANHFAISPNEPIAVDQILNAFEKDSILGNYKVVLRFHPMDDYERWKPLLARYPNVIVSIPWSHQDSKSIFWGNPTLDDLILFSNVLRYSSVMLNIASTVAIDAAITDTPIVCVGFHPSVKTEGDFYNEVHYSEHYAPIMQTQATPLADSMLSLLDLVKEQVENPNKLQKERICLKEYFLARDIKSSSSLLVQKLVKKV